MIYDNCIKYIDKELKRNLIDKEWKQKYFLIYGLDSLGKTVYMLFKEYKLLFGFAAILVTALVMNLILGAVTGTSYFNPGFAGQPIAHTDGLWNALGMYLAGFGCILLGGCPLRQLILAGEGNTDSAVTVLGLMAGAAFAHNFGLASSGEGPTVNGKIAVIIGIVVVAVIAAVNSMRKEEA